MQRIDIRKYMSCFSFLLAFSLHLGLENNYNNIHPHIRCTDNQTIYGGFYNSEKNVSLFYGKKYKNIEYGLVTGYSGGNILPMVRYKKNKFFIAPAYEMSGNYGLVIGIEYE